MRYKNYEELFRWIRESERKKEVGWYVEESDIEDEEEDEEEEEEEEKDDDEAHNIWRAWSFHLPPSLALSVPCMENKALNQESMYTYFHP